MNWKISRIEIASFKAFRKLSLDVTGASLLTLDGPNGFGKTSIFDALELLFTGKIERVKRLFTKLMTAQKIHYQDNLYWNIRSTESDLYVKVEFSDGTRSLVLARHAKAKDRKTTTNRADKFELFRLYKLDSFESTELIPVSESLIAQEFGSGFQGNYAFLNYLEQGQNEYLFSTRIDHRKNALEELINTTAINADIEKCKEAERGLNQRIKVHEAQEKELVDASNLLRALLEVGLEGVEHKRISTSDIQPGWDKEQLFITYSKEAHDNYIADVRKLSELIPLKQAIKIRVDNERIETYIIRNNELLKAIAQLGKTTGELANLDSLKKELDLLRSAQGTLQKGSIAINFAEIATLPSWDPDEFKEIEEQIKHRDRLVQATAAGATISAEIARLKRELVAEHLKLVADDKDCPLCGADWGSHQALLLAIEKRAEAIESSLSADGKTLLEVASLIGQALDTLSQRVDERIAKILGIYNADLHSLLIEQKEKIPRIQEIIIRLEANNYTCPDNYTLDQLDIENRHSQILASIRATKKDEIEALPEDWRRIINSAFKAEDDFYLLEMSSLDLKSKYIALKANEAKSTDLSNHTEKLKKILKEKQAATAAKEKLTQLKNVLIGVEKVYSDQTISEIELIFHIYSGRLIQNYQRGLGLFIESRDGKQLRFSTAESSEHDAILAMSSGQISALSLAFFFSLNKVYSRVPIVMIDDPSQSLDEVNIASLTDLLRCELKDRQLIVSSHEEDISSYMRYRFAKAGLTPLTLNMQSLSREAS